MNTQGEGQMELTTSESTMMEVEDVTPEPTPCARRTRSHDNPPPDTVQADTLQQDTLEVAKKQTEAKRKLISTPEPTAVSLNEYTEKTEDNHDLVDLTVEEEEVDRRRFYHIIGKLNSTHSRRSWRQFKAASNIQ